MSTRSNCTYTSDHTTGGFRSLFHFESHSWDQSMNELQLHGSTDMVLTAFLKYGVVFN